MTAADTMGGLTSTTAPGKVFGSRSELAAHYQTQWHQYNLKRRQAGLPMLLEADFEARLAAAQALRNETKVAGKDHLKQSKSRKENKKKNKGDRSNTIDDNTNGAVRMVPQVPTYNRIKEEQERADTTTESPLEATPMETTNDNENDKSPKETTVETPATDDEKNQDMQEADADNAAALEPPEKVEIDPLQSLFDRHLSATVEANVDRMYRKYGFFVPDREYCSDLEGLVGYLHEKIKLGHMCIYCHRVFTTWQGCQKHMISKQHTKIRYEAGIDMEDLSVFYDFQEENERFLRSNTKTGTTDGQDMDTSQDKVAEDNDNGINDEEDDDEDGWEDVSDDEEMAEGEEATDDIDEDDYSEFEEEVARMGFDITALGELVFPDGRIVGHRSLRRYYNQRAPRPDDTRASVQAARLAAGERLYRGRVYQLGGDSSTRTARNSLEASRAQALALSSAGVAPGLATGRAGKGILVPSGSSVGNGFTQISVYRFRAVLRKQRRDDARGKRLMDRTRQNINRMDKKANRLMNNVSVAHAAR